MALCLLILPVKFWFSEIVTVGNGCLIFSPHQLEYLGYPPPCLWGKPLSFGIFFAWVDFQDRRMGMKSYYQNNLTGNLVNIFLTQNSEK